MSLAVALSGRGDDGVDRAYGSRSASRPSARHVLPATCGLYSHSVEADTQTQYRSAEGQVRLMGLMAMGLQHGR